METLYLIASSGVVAFVVTFSRLRKYKQKIDEHEKAVEKLQNEMKEITKNLAKLYENIL
jgi:uncharacterized protein YoxC